MVTDLGMWNQKFQYLVSISWIKKKKDSIIFRFSTKMAGKSMTKGHVTLSSRPADGSIMTIVWGKASLSSTYKQWCMATNLSSLTLRGYFGEGADLRVNYMTIWRSIWEDWNTTLRFLYSYHINLTLNCIRYWGKFCHLSCIYILCWKTRLITD